MIKQVFLLITLVTLNACTSMYKDNVSIKPNYDFGFEAELSTFAIGKRKPSNVSKLTGFKWESECIIDAHRPSKSRKLSFAFATEKILASHSEWFSDNQCSRLEGIQTRENIIYEVRQRENSALGDIFILMDGTQAKVIRKRIDKSGNLITEENWGLMDKGQFPIYFDGEYFFEGKVGRANPIHIGDGSNCKNYQAKDGNTYCWRWEKKILN